MAFAPDRTHFQAYETYRKERPKSATIMKDIYGAKSSMNTPSSAEAAYLIMKKIHRTAGDVSPERGKSLFENLQYIKTEPSVKVLQKTSWRQYFQDIGGAYNLVEEETGKNSHFPPRSHQPQKQQQYNQQISPKQAVNQQVVSNEIDYPTLFNQLVKRTLYLWKELHIPDSDRDYYSYSLLQGPFQDTSQINVLSSYVCLLRRHRESSIQTLHSIRERESCVTHCIELLASAKRLTSLKYVSIHEGIERSAEVNERTREIAREIQLALQAVQSASLQVAQKIRIWRENMWRPQPFM
jgi:hypothetical protein